MWKRVVWSLLAVGLLGCGEGDGDAPDGAVVDASVDAAMAPPLECGDLTCGDGEYCYETSGGVAPTFDHACRPLPEGCASCDCLGDEGGFCSETDAGLYVSVPLP